MRDSRIPHPLGGRFVQLHVWAVEAVGFSAAAVLGLLDYLDRRADRPGEMLATRARVIADLQGVVGRNSVDRALDDLAARGWVELHEITATGANITTTYWYSLHADAVAQHLRDCGKAGVPNPGRRKSRNRDRNRDRGGDADQLPDVDIDVQQHAQRTGAAARGTKARRVRSSGVVTYYDHDVIEAERLEVETPPEELRTAVTALHAAGREAVPGRVARELEQRRRAANKEERRRAEAARAAADEAAHNTPEARARSEQAYERAMQQMGRRARGGTA